MRLRAASAPFGTPNGEQAAVVLDGVVAFLKMLQANDYSVNVDSSGLRVPDPLKVVLTSLKALVLAGQLLPFHVCLEPIGSHSKLPLVAEAHV
jgi:hypothetical protein